MKRLLILASLFTAFSASAGDVVAALQCDHNQKAMYTMTNLANAITIGEHQYNESRGTNRFQRNGKIVTGQSASDSAGNIATIMFSDNDLQNNRAYLFAAGVLYTCVITDAASV